MQPLIKITSFILFPHLEKSTVGLNISLKISSLNNVTDLVATKISSS